MSNFMRFQGDVINFDKVVAICKKGDRKIELELDFSCFLKQAKYTYELSDKLNRDNIFAKLQADVLFR